MRSRWLGPAVVAAMWVFAAAVYTRLPERVPSHWNLQGEVDSWMTKPWGPLMTPLIATFMLAVFLVLPRLDPRRANSDYIAEVRRLALNLLTCFFAVLEVAVLGSALGWPVQADRVMLVATGLLFIGLGNFMPRIRSNWLVGFRTPWTMDNERVWRATHRVGGRALVAAGAMIALGALLAPGVRGWMVAAGLATGVGVPFIYSYIAYRRDTAGRPV